MPELPEVETVRKTLERLLIGTKITSVNIKYSKIIKDISIEEFEKSIINQKINKLNRIGKYLVFELDDYALISHLRMEGKYFYREESFNDNHDHISFGLDNNKYLVYNDTRKFGTMHLVDIYNYKNHPILAKLGYEPNSINLTPEYLFAALNKKNVAIKTALLDQTIVSGLGNIYADEVLFESSILPTRKCSNLTMVEYSNIVNAINKVINKAIYEGGTTIKSFSSSEGVHGKFQNSLNVHTKKNCSVCNLKVTKIKLNGRGTYFCHNCQK